MPQKHLKELFEYKNEFLYWKIQKHIVLKLVINQDHYKIMDVVNSHLEQVD